jgi:A/G-specific adenine glycosylase
MLQQTQMDRGVEYFNRWMARFPHIHNVARAKEDEILRAWEGLGYYRRAKNLHKTARIIVDQHNGLFPRDPHHLARLPGIGPYTAAAIASIAFEQPVPVVDANVCRVLARVFDIDTLITTAATRSLINARAADLVPAARARDFNQAIMELGALVCKKSPQCMQCPLQSLCASLARGNMLERPVTPKPPATIALTRVAGILVHEGRVFVQKRPDDALWANLWEFPGGNVIPGESPEAAIVREFLRQTGLRVRVENQAVPIKHNYTRYKITLHGFCCSVPPSIHPVVHSAREYRWVRPDSLNHLAFPTSHRKLMRLFRGDLVSQGQAEPLVSLARATEPDP